MLYKETVSEETLEMIQLLMKDEKLKDFLLVGGTSLALRLGHRKSVDIDLFTSVQFERYEVEKHLREKLDPDLIDQKSYGMTVTKGRENIDLWYYPVGSAEKPEEIEGIRMLSVVDVAAMKINSIAFANYRNKDYIDLYYVLEKKCLNDLEKAYQKKYPDLPAKEHVKKIDSVGSVRNSKLDVFDKKLTWEKVEKRLKQAILFPKKIFRNGLDRRRGL